MCCYKQHNACVAWVSEAGLKPAETYKKRMSVQRNTEGWLMGCRGEGKEDSGQVGERGGVQSSSTRGVLETQIIGFDPRKKKKKTTKKQNKTKTDMQLSNHAFCSE